MMPCRLGQFACALQPRAKVASIRLSVFSLIVMGIMLGFVPAAAQAQILPFLLPISIPLSAENSDPIPIRRVLVPLERVSAELERAGAKKLIHLTQEEFDARLRAARLALDGKRERPRLASTRYRATLTESALVGQADFSLTNPSLFPALLSIWPFNLAIQKPMFDGAPAILGDIEPRTLGLLIESPGTHRLTFDWSLRGEAGPNGLRFDLRIPSCVITSLELNLPAERLLSAPPEQCLVTGPFPAAAADRERWTVEVFGRSRIELSVRVPGRRDRGDALVVARIEERQDLSLDQVECVHDFALEVSRGSLRELDIDLTPGLQPLTLSYRNSELEDWQLLPPTPGRPNPRLHVRLPELLQNGPATLRIRAIAPIHLGELWQSPAMRLHNAVATSESLTIQFPQEMELSQWNPGIFDLQKTTSDASGNYLLQLQAGPLPRNKPPGNDGRPQARPRLRTVQASARMQLWWEIEPAGERLRARASVLARGGPAFRLQFRIPAGWRVDRADLQPAGALGDWIVLDADKADPLLLIHLNQAIEAEQTLTVLLSLSRSSSPSAAGVRSLPVPHVDLVQAQTLDCELGVSLAPQLRIKSSPGGVHWSRPRAGDAGSENEGESADQDKPLWSGHSLWGLTHFRRRPPGGDLVVEGLAPRVLVRSNCRIDVSADRPQVGVRLEFEPQAGTPDSIDVQFSEPIPAQWSWIGADGRPVESRPAPLWEAVNWPGLTVNALQAALALDRTFARQNINRFTLPEPLTARQAIEARPAELPTSSQGRIPLPIRASGLPIAGEVELVGLQEGRCAVESHGLVNRQSLRASNAKPEREVLVYEGGVPSLRLTDSGSAGPAAKTPQVRDVLYLTLVERSSHLQECLRFRLRPFGSSSFSLAIPGDADLVSVLVNHRWTGVSGTKAEDGYQLIPIPTPAATAECIVEVMWERTVPDWLFWQRIQSVPPKFPVETPSWKRLWSLAPGLVPLNAASLVPLPGFPSSDNSWQMDSRLTNRLFGRRDRALVQHLVAETELRLRGLANDLSTMPLGARLQFLQTELARGQLGFVVDAEALRTRGLTPLSMPGEFKQPAAVISPVPNFTRAAPFLEPFGLELIAATPVPLLTTQRARAAMGPGDASAITELAILQAVRLGQDATGRFVNGAAWLADSHCPGAISTGPDEQSISLPGWPCWQVRGGSVDAVSLSIVRQDFLTWTGTFFVLALAALGWSIRKSRVALIAFAFLFAFCLSGASFLLAPDTFRTFGLPLFAGMLLWLAALIVRGTSVPDVASGVARAPLALIALLLLGAFPGRAAAPADNTVFLLSEDGGKKIGILAPPALLDSLNALVVRGKQPLDRPLLLDARYVCAASGASVEFTADFTIYCPGPGPTDYLLPIESVELRAATCDQAPAFPLAASGGQGGYLFRFPGGGVHHLHLQFSTPIVAQGADRECRVVVPETACSELDFQASPNSTRLQAVSARGRQEQLAGSRLHADLGRVALLQIRWRASETKEEPPLLEVKELFAWDLQTTRRLLGVLRYQVVRGFETVLEIDLPAEWEIRRLETASLAGGAANRLRDWKIAPGPKGSRLRLEFQAPLVAGVQVFLELLSRQPATTEASLVLPAPVGAVSTSGMLAYHLGRRDVTLTESLGFTGIDLNAFIAQWQKAGVEDPGVLKRAFSFRRSAGSTLSMHLNLHAPNGPTAVQELVWRLGPRELICEGTLQLAGNEEDLMLVEWEQPPGLRLEEVAGPEVYSWSVADRHVQVWLRPGTNDTAITFRAWAPNDRPPGELLSLSFPRLSHVASVKTTVRLEADPGWSVSAESIRNLRALPSVRDAQVFSADQEDIACEVRLRETPVVGTNVPAPKPAEAPPSTALAKTHDAYLALDEQSCLLQADNSWLHQADYILYVGASQILLYPPGDARLTSALLDGQELDLENPECLTLRLDGMTRRRYLRIRWRWPSQSEYSDFPLLHRPRLENVSPLPGIQQSDEIWKILVPSGKTIEPANGSAVPMSPASRYVRRALAYLRAARFFRSRENALADEAEQQSWRNMQAASAWLAQSNQLQECPASIPGLESSLRDLENANRLLVHDSSDAEQAWRAEWLSSSSAPEKEKTSPWDCGLVSEQGLVSYWQATNAQPGVHVGNGSGQIVQQSTVWLALALGGLLFWLVSPWTSLEGRAAWRPEFMGLWGLVAGLLFSSWFLALGCVAAALLWRLALLGLAVARAVPKQDRTKPSSSHTPVPG